MKTRVVISTVIGCVALAAATSTFAGNWPQWRGPFLNGSAKEKNLPAQWSKTNNIAWVCPMPGTSGATPVVWGDSVFVSSTEAPDKLVLIRVDRKTGKVRWKKQGGTGNRTMTEKSNLASPSPVTDGKTVWIMYGTGELAAFDFSGRDLWKRNLSEEYGKLSLLWIYGSTPLLYKDRLYVQVLQSNPPRREALDDKPKRESFLLCLDPATGTNIWRHIRPTDAVEESMEAYSTPIPSEYKGRSEILIVGGDYLTGHDAKTGDELWRAGGLNTKRDPTVWRIVPSPVTGAGMIFVCAPKRDPVFAFKDGGSGDVTQSHLAWTLKEFPSDCATPLFYRDKLFVLDGDKQMMTCLEPKTGKTIWRKELGLREIFRASPTGADGKIYCQSVKGTAVVLNAEDGNVLSTIPFDEGPAHSTIVAADGSLFIRTANNLYCVGLK